MNRFLLVSWLMFVINTAFSQEYKPVAQKVHNLEIENKFIQTPALFTISGEKPIPASVVENAGILNFNSVNALEIIIASPENIQLTVPVSNSNNINLKLFRSDIFTPDFTITTSSLNGNVIPVEKGLHYWGIIDNDYSSIAAISIFKDEVMGMISSPSTGNIILGAITGDSKFRHIIYRESDFHIAAGPGCATVDVPGNYKNSDLHVPATASTSCIRLYWEANYDLFQNKGSIANVTNYLTGVFNQSAILYSNDGIPVSLSQLFIWDTSSPYTATSTSGLLSQFQSYRNSFNGDLGHLIGIAGGGGIAASTSGLCNGFLDYSQCYSGVSTSYSNVPTFSWTVEVVTHEQGHLMGSKHTHACVWNGNNTAIDGCGPAAGYTYEGSCSGAPIPSNGGTIMSYCHLISAGINFSNGFGTQPKNVILNRFNNSSCLTSCTGGATCSAPAGLTTSSVTTNSATLSWSAAAGASSYNVQYRVIGNSSWSSASTSAVSLVLNSLVSGSNYEWQVSTVCSSGSSAFSSTINFSTPGGINCGIPSGLNTSSITSSSATCAWTTVSGATSYKVQYRTAGSTTWSSANTASTSISINNLLPGSVYEWQVQANCSSGSSAFTASANFTTATIVTCGVPAGMNTSAITTTSATFSWTGVTGAVTYLVQYRIAGTASWTMSLTATTSFQAQFLSPGTNYEWQVQANCSAGASAFTASTNFTTTAVATCGVPSVMNTTSITTTSATLSWTGMTGAMTYLVQYRITGSTSWTSSLTASTSLQVGNLSPGTNYEWKVQTNCSGGSSAFSSTANFTTSFAVTCGTPSGVSVNNILNNEATVTWNAVSGATGYILQWKLVSQSIWSSVTNFSTNYFTLTGLSNCSSYQCVIQAVCPSGVSANSAVYNFTTDGCHVNYCVSRGNNSSHEYINRVSIGSINNTSGNDNGYGNYTSLSTTLSANTAYLISLTPGFQSAASKEFWTIYIDFNQNGSFTEGNERVASGNSSVAVNLLLKIPGTALNGATRMRIQMRNSSAKSNSCTLFANGEVEDYTIVISGGARIAQKTDDGLSTETLGEIIEKENPMSVYPNPAKDQLTVSVNGLGENCNIRIYDTEGRELFQETRFLVEGNNKIDINTTELTNGLYFISVEGSVAPERMKFFIFK